MYERLFQLQEDTLKTLASQKRLEIVQLLKKRELTVSELVDMLGIPQANVSQHLAQLRRHKVVTTRRSGKQIYYSLSDKRIAQLVSLLRDFLKAQFLSDPDIAKISSFDKRAAYPIVRDPVCGMRMSINEVAESAHYESSDYYFCGQGCYSSFHANPPKFAKNLAKV
ncbi:MAG TPA: metalloregulator ArsR/SmtB family transcription factor [Candidatus Saccharimonadales bacterium]|jgi:ArsR family transcriptional regulator